MSLPSPGVDPPKGLDSCLGLLGVINPRNPFIAPTQGRPSPSKVTAMAACPWDFTGSWTFVSTGGRDLSKQEAKLPKVLNTLGHVPRYKSHLAGTFDKTRLIYNDVTAIKVIFVCSMLFLHISSSCVK